MSLPLRQSPRKAKSLVSPSIAMASTERKTRRTKVEPKEEKTEPKAKPTTTTKATTKAKTATKRKVKEEEEEEVEVEEKKPKTKPAKKAKTTKSKTDKDEPLAERTDVASLSKAMYIGAHVSSAGGVQNAPPNAQHLGANAFALFLKSQRKWQNPPLADDARDGFRSSCDALGFDAGAHCLPHGSYLVNLAQADAAKAAQAYAGFVDDLKRCDALGIRLYNFHPGANVAGSGTRSEALTHIADAINRAHGETTDVITVLENMAGGGTTVGDRFSDLAEIIGQIQNKSRVGVCLDTCHAFAAGYDLRTPSSFAAVMEDFDKTVGLQYLKAWHVNDSKAPLGSRRDLHANIGTGFLGLRAFHSLVNDARFAGMPMVLETPIDRKGKDGKSIEDHQVWADEIKLLESLIDMDADTDAFRAKEKALQAEGAQERKRIQEQVDKKKKK